jgi:hypothetical protein
MSKVKYVDINKTLDSLDIQKAYDLVLFHRHLKNKSLWRLEKQIQLIKELTKRIHQSIIEEDINQLTYYMCILKLHYQYLLFNDDKLVDARYNPLTHFLHDCETSKIHEYGLTKTYVDFLLEIGDDRINKEVFHEIEGVCNSRYVNIGIDRDRN